MRRESTVQQLAPVSASGLLRAFGVWVGVVTTATGALETCFPSCGGASCAATNGLLDAVALVVLAAAGVVFAVRSSPFRAPFRRADHLIVVGIAFASMVVEEFASGGQNIAIHDDWGLVVVPLYLLAVSTMRPAMELLITGLVTTLAVGVLAAATTPLAVSSTLPATRAVIAMSSLLPAAVAGALFARVATRRIRLNRERTHRVDPGDPRSARRSEQQQNVARLEAEVVPLLQRIIRDRAVTASDAETARALATDLRAMLIAGLGRSWLEEAGCAVTDPDGYVERMSVEQRTAIRAVLGALPMSTNVLPAQAVFTGQDTHVVLDLTVQFRSRVARAELAAAMQYVRTVYPRVAQRLTDHTIELHAEFRVDEGDPVAWP